MSNQNQAKPRKRKEVSWVAVAGTLAVVAYQLVHKQFDLPALPDGVIEALVSLGVVTAAAAPGLLDKDDNEQGK